MNKQMDKQINDKRKKEKNKRKKRNDRKQERKKSWCGLDKPKDQINKKIKEKE